ncbi:MAG: ADP-ribose pyrophosphatase YjhB (NUDIX family) [Candidatus Azotimanducaceae bacterium]|jgi:ADP-ribose pyrophosphatase YjhB (NUDIX family)
MSWPPHITVATVVQRDQTYLMVEEEDNHQRVINQPAGHLEPNETLLAAAIRETLEETAWQVSLSGLVGIYQYFSAHNDTTYLRFCFAANAIKQQAQAIDPDIVAVHWLTKAEIIARPQRSPLVLQSIEDALKGHLTPLDHIQQF